MRRTAENAEIQARAIRANALHQQQETTLMVADRVHRQLGAVVGLDVSAHEFAGPAEEVEIGGGTRLRGFSIGLKDRGDAHHVIRGDGEEEIARRVLGMRAAVGGDQGLGLLGIDIEIAC